MSHPPIPPKCEEFFCTENPGMFSAPGHDYDLYMPESKCRRVIAAVAEVEWRKRAERWGKVLDKIRLRWNQFKPMRHPGKRFEAYLKRFYECYDTAAAWREWGILRCRRIDPSVAMSRLGEETPGDSGVHYHSCLSRNHSRL